MQSRQYFSFILLIYSKTLHSVLLNAILLYLYKTFSDSGNHVGLVWNCNIIVYNSPETYGHELKLCMLNYDRERQHKVSSILHSC